MMELLCNNYIYLLAGAGFLLFLLYLALAFTDWIPHFLLAVYLVLPLFYRLAHLQDLPLTTVFVLLLGPVIMLRADWAFFARFWPVTLYLVLVVAVSTVNQVPLNDYRSTFVPLLICLLCAVSLGSEDPERQIRSFSGLIVAWVALNAIFSILQFTAGKEFYLISVAEGNSVMGVKRGYGLIGMATQVGLHFCLGVPLAAAMLLGGKRKALLLALFVLACVGLVLAFSRGAIIGVLISLFFLLASQHRFKSCLALGASLTGLVVVYSAVSTLLPHDYSLFFQAKDGSAATRMPFTIVALKMFAERPWIGFGFGGFAKYCTQYGLRLHIESHNTFTQVLVEYGLLGFIPFLLLITQSLAGYAAYLRRGASRILRLQLTGYLAALLAILIDATVHCVEWNLILWVPLTVGYLARYLVAREARENCEVCEADAACKTQLPRIEVLEPMASERPPQQPKGSLGKPPGNLVGEVLGPV